MHKSSLTLLAALVCAGTTHADLIVHVVSDGMLARKTNNSYCNAPPTPDEDVLYLDVRLAPAANLYSATTVRSWSSLIVMVRAHLRKQST